MGWSLGISIFNYACIHAKSIQLCPTLLTLWTVQAPLSMRFSRQYWNGFPYLPPGDLPDPGIKPGSPALAGRFFTLSHLGSPFSYTLSDLETEDLDFPGSIVDGSPPTSAGDTGSIPDPGRFHMSRSNQASVPELLTPYSGAHELQLLGLCAATAEVHVPRACAL